LCGSGSVQWSRLYQRHTSKKKMSYLPIKHVIGQITSWSTIDTHQKMSILSQNNCLFEQTISPFTIDTSQKMSILIQDNCLFKQTTSPSTIENLHDMRVVTPTHTRTRKMFIRTNNFPLHYWHPSKDNSHTLTILVCFH
jgi:hypothetical protein